jgi:hypothetical protein
MDALWAVVVEVSPLLVRMPGDSGDTPVAWKDSGMSFSTSDKVGLVRFGSQWVVVAKIVAT